VPSRASRVRRFDDDLGILGLPGDVSPWDIRFDPSDPADLEPLGAGRFRIRVHAEPGLTEGRAVLRDRSGVLGLPLDPMPAGRFVLWSVVVGPLAEPVGLSFAFLAADSRRPVYFVPSGTSASVERLDRWEIEPGAEPLDVPEWAKGALIYQIFPERFANGDSGNDPDGVVRWGTTPRSRQFQGGDLSGIVQRLDHLRGMGVDAIYLNPIFESPSNHKYDTVDYLTVDAAFGGNEALRELVTAAHDSEMRVILDASFNHAHPRFFAFADLVAKGKRSRYRDWFVVDDWPVRIRVRPDVAPAGLAEWVRAWESEAGVPVEMVEGEGPALETTYEAWYGVPTMPRIDLSNDGARAYVLDVARHWLSEFDIDGWRMDVARYVDPDFWPDFRKACREVKPDAYLLAEVMGDVSDWLRGDSFDATMNYTFRSLALGFFATGDMDGITLLDHCTRLYGRHSFATTLVNHNLLGSHDTPRFRTEAGGDLWRLELATVFQLLFPGAPGIYYGDEVGLTGGDDPGCRAVIPWDDLDGRRGLIEVISELSQLRRRIPALRVGEYRPLASSRDAIVFERSIRRSRYVVGVNRSRSRRIFELKGSGEVVWGSGKFEGDRLEIAGRSAVVIRL
jgi:glycosidase